MDSNNTILWVHHWEQKCLDTIENHIDSENQRQLGLDWLFRVNLLNLTMWNKAQLKYLRLSDIDLFLILIRRNLPRPPSKWHLPRPSASRYFWWLAFEHQPRRSSLTKYKISNLRDSHAFTRHTCTMRSFLEWRTYECISLIRITITLYWTRE